MYIHRGSCQCIKIAHISFLHLELLAAQPYMPKLPMWHLSMIQKSIVPFGSLSWSIRIFTKLYLCSQMIIFKFFFSTVAAIYFSGYMQHRFTLLHFNTKNM